MAIRIQLRRDTADNWSSANPILLAGELGIETDTLKIKIGNGNNWNSIISYANTTPSEIVNTLGDYILLSDMGQANGVATLDSAGKIPVAQLGNIIDSAPGVLDTLNEIAAAINDDANFATTMTTLINNTATNAANDATTKANGAVTTAAAYTDNEIDTLHTTLTGEISTHNSDTTSVHGIANTADLASKTYADGAATTAANAAQLAAESTADTALTAHTNDSTNVHGIVDTAQLATKTYADGAAQAVEAQLPDYASLSGAQFTGGIYGTTANMSGQITAGSVVVDGNLTVNGITTTVNTTDMSIADNLIYLNEALEYSITGVTGNGTNQTYTTSTNHNITDSMVVRITGVDPSGYNKSTYVDVVSVTANTITVAGTETGSYVSGGTIFGKADVNPDLGFVGGYNDGSYSHAGLVRDASDNGVWKLFNGVTTEPTSAIDFTTYTRAALEIGALYATGALIGDVTNTELQRVHGVTSPIQDQLNSKQAIVSGVSDTEIGYLDGVTSGIQSQLNLKSPIDAPTFTGKVTVSSSGIEFADGVQTKQATPSITPIISKTADYTLSSLSERDSMIEVNSASAVTITIPPSSSVNFPVGASLDVMGINTGLVTIAGGVGVTVNATPGLKLRTQWSSVTLFKRGSDSWVVYGDLKA